MAAQIENEQCADHDGEGGGADDILPPFLRLGQSILFQRFQVHLANHLAALNDVLARHKSARDGGNVFAGLLAGGLGQGLVVGAVGHNKGGDHFDNDVGLVFRERQADQGGNVAAHIFQAVLAHRAAHHLLQNDDGFLVNHLPARFAEG